jgi:hypothetical protein
VSVSKKNIAANKTVPTPKVVSFKTRIAARKSLELLGWYEVGSGYWTHSDQDRRFTFEEAAQKVLIQTKSKQRARGK